MTKKQQSKVSGFTLIELVVTIGIVGILIGFAVPAMQDTIRKNRMLGESDRIVGVLTQARNAAISLGRPSFVCRTTSAGRPAGDPLGNERFSCRTAGMGALDWANDVIAYTHLPNRVVPAPNNRFANQRLQNLLPTGANLANRRQAVDAVSKAPQANIVLTANRNDFVIRFNSDGTLANTAPFRIAVCDTGDRPETYGRIIEIGAAGQIRSAAIEITDDDRDCTPTVNI